MAEIDNITVAFGTGTTSPPVAISNKSIVGIQFPSNWLLSNTVTMQASIDGGATFGNVLTVAGPVYAIGSSTAPPNGSQSYIAIDPNTLRGVNLIQLVSTVAQTNSPTLTLVTRLAL